MEEDTIDNIFREKLKNNSKIPSNVNWKKELGWSHLEKLLPRKLAFNSAWMKIAVGAAIIVISFCGGFLIQKYFSKNTFFASEADKAVKEIDLPGGHHCSLAPYSKIQFVHSPVSLISDTLYIEGEAFVESLGKSPLIIIAKNSVIQCLGAKLNVRANITDKTTVISTVSGKVSVKCTDNHMPALVVAPSEQYSIFEGGIMAFKAQNKDPNFLAWKTGTLTFDNVPLEYAVKIMEDYYGVCISIEKDEIKFCRITSQFKNLSLKEALQNIESNLNVQVKQKGLMYLLSGKGC